MLVTSSGVLAGMWPCGILIMLKELFIAESKSIYIYSYKLKARHRCMLPYMNC